MHPKLCGSYLNNTWPRFPLESLQEFFVADLACMDPLARVLYGSQNREQVMTAEAAFSPQLRVLVRPCELAACDDCQAGCLYVKMREVYVHMRACRHGRSCRP